MYPPPHKINDETPQGNFAYQKLVINDEMS